MKNVFFAGLLAAGSLWAGSPFAGRWQGKLAGLPGATLTVQERDGRLSGSITFYLIVKDEKGTRVDGKADCELLAVAAHGKEMTFEVRHHLRHGGPEYGPNAKVLFVLTGKNEANLRNLGEGDSTPSMPMQRE